MSSLFDTNRASLKKLFAAHEKEGTLRFTELLKLCSSTRIFPDLLASPELHKILVDVAQDPMTSSISQNLSYSQFEIFLSSVSAKAFPFKNKSEQEAMLFMHLKNSCGLRYGADFDVILEKKPNIHKKIPRLNIDSTKMHRQTPKTTRRVSIKPSSTKNIKSSSFLFRTSPRKESVETKHKVHPYSIITPRTNHRDKNMSTKPSPRPVLTQRNPLKPQKTTDSLKNSSNVPVISTKLIKLTYVLNKFKKNWAGESEKNFRTGKFVKFLAYLEKNYRAALMQLKFSFKLWALVTRRLRP